MAKHKHTTKNKKESLLARSGLGWFHWLVVSLSILVTLTAWYISKSQIEEKNDVAFQREAEQVINLIQERMQVYENALWGGVALLDSNNGAVTYSQWLKYASSLNIDRTYPGINGIGVIYNVQRDTVDAYLNHQKIDRPDFKIHPVHQRSELWPITYIIPVQPNKNAVGLDIAFEDNRYTAVNKAQETGTAQITGPITLVQDSAKTPGFLFYTPFYKNGEKPSTPTARNRDIVGVTYAPFIMSKLMNGALSLANRQVFVTIKDGDDLLYQDSDHDNKSMHRDPNPLLQKNFQLPLYGRVWTIGLETNLEFRHINENQRPLIILFAGGIIDFMLLALFFTMAQSKNRAISYADRLTKDLQQQSKKAEAASRSKTHFLTNMSHEIRTPMNSILMSIELATKKSLSDEVRDLLSISLTSAKNLLIIINDILDFSKMESGKIDIVTQTLSLPNLLTQTVKIMDPLAKEKGLTVTCQNKGEIPTLIEGDEGRLQQIINNLVNNALKFTDEGQVNIIVEFTKTQANFGQLKIRVIDTGRGITPENQTHLFERFYQVRDEKQQQGGSGLGLAICKQLVSLMGGEIGIISDGVQGCEFWFTVSTQIVDGAAINIEEDITPPLSGLHILLAEDVVVNQLLIKKSLEAMGHTVTLAENGQVAVDLIVSKADFDLILMDNQMPVMTGVEATEAIRASDHAQKNIPIIALTADAFDGQKSRFLAVGMDGFVAKPIVETQLIAEIARVMANKTIKKQPPASP